MNPTFSIIIPGYNRPGPLRHTLRSAALAAARLPAGGVEIILVDDGSTPPLPEQIADFDPGHPLVHLRQANAGSIQARLHGLRAARGEFVLFLDSDDLIHPEKLSAHLALARARDAAITYDDMALARLTADNAAEYQPQPGPGLATVDTVPELVIRVQPLPHVIVYRRDYLLRALSKPLVPPVRAMDAAGDAWLYYCLCTYPARIAKLDRALTAIGPHESTRYSHHWEKLGVAALLVAEAFQAACPRSDETREARVVVGEVAFDSWRRLPHDFSPAFAKRLLNLWKNAPRNRLIPPGGARFTLLARCVGPVAAGRILRRLFGQPYAACRTLDETAITRLLADHGIE